MLAEHFLPVGFRILGINFGVQPSGVTLKPASWGHLKTGQLQTIIQDTEPDAGTLSSVLVSNVLSAEKKQQIIALGSLGWTVRRIQRETGVRRETISSYLKEAGVELRPPRGRVLISKPASLVGGVTPDPERQNPAENDTIADSDQSKPASQTEPVTPDSDRMAAGETDVNAASQSSGSSSASVCEAYRDAIELGLSRGRNAKAIWQDLVDGYGFAGGYQSVKRFVRKCRGQHSPEARAVIETAPGEESQVDYGTGPMVRDARSGKYRRTRLFVLTLGYSRKSVRLLMFQSSSQIWAELHEKAFRRLGGTTRTIVLDNLREGVLSPDIYDPTINPLYRDVLKHYGTVPLPCRVADPDRKGKVESGVGHAQKTPLKGLRFETLEAAQTYLDHWEERWADTRIHGTTKRQVAAMFTEERPADTGAMGFPSRALTRPADWRTAARTPASGARWTPHGRAGSSQANATGHGSTPIARR
jgi:transposase